MRARLEPILTELGFLSDSENAAVLADRARQQGPELLARLHDQVVKHYHASLVQRWTGWATCERVLVAEVAAAARVGLIPAEGGLPLDQTRFDAAIDHILGTQDETHRQDLFGRWSSLAGVLRHLRISDMHLPSLQTERQLIEGLGRLTSEVLAHAHVPKSEAPGLLEFLDVLRELTTLMVREKIIRDRGGVPDLDADFRASLTPLVSDVLPRVLRTATMEVDAISLRQAAALPSASVPRTGSGNALPQVEATGVSEHDPGAVAGNGSSKAGRAQAPSSSGDSPNATPQPPLDRHQNGASRDREPTAMQLARWHDILLALPASDRIAMDGSGALLNKLRERASETRTRERIAVRHDKDSLRRDLVSLRARGWVEPKLLIRTVHGDAEAKRQM